MASSIRRRLMTRKIRIPTFLEYFVKREIGQVILPAHAKSGKQGDPNHSRNPPRLRTTWKNVADLASLKLHFCVQVS